MDAMSSNANEITPNGPAGFVQSELFARTFREGMALVEETANYLDGEGREASKQLPRDAALTYAGASMRLTTQLMQIASWLLVLRAVREGEMALSEASESKYRLSPTEASKVEFKSEGLPEMLVTLIDAAQQLYNRISRLDGELFTGQVSAEVKNDAAAQQRTLLKAFASRK
ncbi:DUF1465 family protein [Hyphococcus flavus]|uniref:DUF1465 family protein n=1 Tax=Hyphococcus flavus TaxID=1866326 RepID=A0AAF0CEK3_9PROT|nr:DUF1465 family protein [Hyphococcus flavus]WDI31421.1 DUF1465 family protein [Hyphococcus flavus]